MRPLAFLLFIFSGSLVSAQPHSGEMALIPAGEYTMGKNSENITDWQPEHKVFVDSFYLDRHEVTNSEYYAFCKATGHPLPEFWGEPRFRCCLDYPDHPVVGVTFADAMKYATWAGKRLPTEAEWEYAARGGVTDNDYPWGNEMDTSMANNGKRHTGTIRVGCYAPNGFGLYDMAGNVWEWTSDFYDDDYYTDSPAENPHGPARGRFRVIRGGSWHSGSMCVRTYYRNGLSASWIDFAVGFRCAKSFSDK